MASSSKQAVVGPRIAIIMLIVGGLLVTQFRMMLDKNAMSWGGGGGGMVDSENEMVRRMIATTTTADEDDGDDDAIIPNETINEDEDDVIILNVKDNGDEETSSLKTSTEKTFARVATTAAAAVITDKKLNKKKNYCPYPTSHRPLIHKLPNTSFVSLHLGKGGGGTVDFRMRSLWAMQYSSCHFAPCFNETKHADFVQVNIRDPVDRFVSNFYWRLNLTSDHVEKQRSLGRGLSPEAQALHVHYQGDVNLHAEALCHHNVTLRDQALLDMTYYRHAKYFIADWIPRSMMMLNRTNALIPVVLEKGTDFDAQIDHAVRYVYQNGGFYDSDEADHDDDFENREEWIRYHICKKTKPSEGHLHSSNAPQTGLNEINEKCMVQYFTDDYKFIQELLEKNACKNIGCRNGLKRILKRRLPLLVDNE